MSLLEYIYTYKYIFISECLYKYKYKYICVCVCVNFWDKNRYIFIAIFKFTVNRLKLFVYNFKILYAPISIIKMW